MTEQGGDDDWLQWLDRALAGVGDDLLGPGQSTQMPDFLDAQLAQPASMPCFPGAFASAEAESAPCTSTCQEQASQPSGSSKSRRRQRAPSVQQQAAELEKQIALQTTLVQQLGINNLYLTERVRMLEMVISIRDAQVARVQQITQGLTFNPFAGEGDTGTTIEDIVQAKPADIAGRYRDFTNRLALLLATLVPHIQRHPHLLWGPDKHSHWRSPITASQATRPITEPEPPPAEVEPPARPLCHGTVSCGPPGVQLGPANGHRPGGTKDQPDASVLEDLRTLVVLMDEMQGAVRYMFWLKPQTFLGSSVHTHAIDPNEHTQWDQLLGSSQNSGSASASLPVAPESHWKGVAQSLMLSDHQKLQASVLWDLISSATASVVAHRAALGADMYRLQQQRQQQQQPDRLHPTQGDMPALDRRTSSAGLAVAAGQAASASIGMFSAASSASIASTGSGASEGNLKTTDIAIMQQEEAIMKKLQLTLVKQRCLVILGAEAMNHNILSPVQAAMLCVGCYPFFSDDMALMNAIAAECTPQVLSRLRAASTTA